MSWHEWFGGRDEPWWRLATREPIEVVDEDTGEIVELTPGQDEPDDIEGLLIDFRYVDANGAITRRSLLCWQCWRDGDRIYVRGYCPFREALRTFRVDRMSKVLEVRAGRQIAVEDLETYFAAFAAESTEGSAPNMDFDPTAFVRLEWQSPTPEEIEEDALRRHVQHRARRDCIAGLRIIAYIALADDVRSEQERNVEISYIESRLAMRGYAYDPNLTAALTDVARALAVPPGSFTRAVNEVVTDKDYYHLVLTSAEMLAELDGKVGEIESEALRRLRQAGRKAGWID